MPDILILGEFPWPDGSAASNILRGHGCALQTAGYSVGWLPRRVMDPKNEPGATPLLDRDGFPYWEITERPIKPKLRRWFRENILGTDSRITWLEKQDLRDVRAIFYYPGVLATSIMIFRLKKLCRALGIKLFGFVVEWHDRHHYRGGRFSPSALDGELQRRFANFQLDGVICISRFLHNFYSAKRQRSVLIPAILNLEEKKWIGCETTETSTRPIQLLFLGSARRERHDITLRAVQHMRKEGKDVVIQYLGCSREDILATPGVGFELLDALGDGVQFLGRVSTEKLFATIRSAHFGVLLREDARWSRACFPSKVPELLALGVPLLCNLTSDLGEYLEDGRDAIIVGDLSVASVVVALERICALSAEEFLALRTSARKTAHSFDGTQFSTTYRDLIESPPSKAEGSLTSRPDTLRSSTSLIS